MQRMLTVFASVLCLALAMAVAPLRAAEPLKILFVDTGNTGRSISAETVGRLYAASHKLAVAFISRGLDMDPFDRQVEMNAQILWRDRGVDLSARRADQLVAGDAKHADLILTMTAKHRDRVLAAFPDAKDKTFILSEYAGSAGDIEDAWGKPMAAYENMLSALDAAVPLAVDKGLATVKKAP